MEIRDSEKNQHCFFPAMPPQTPRSNAKSGVSITPSFSFGLGLLPSFRFGSPRNINLLSSLSPHRFFNRFAKGKDEDLKKEDGEENPFDHPNPAAAAAAGPSTEKDSFELDKHSDTMNDSADIWSLTNDSQYQSLSLNLTSINEDTSPKSCEPFLSPHDMFLKKPADIKDSGLKSSPVDKGDTPSSTSSNLKRKRSIDDSPCATVVAQISNLDSPQANVPYDDLEKSSKELWFSELDDVLVRCHKKYKSFKASQSPGSTLTKLTSQNQVLSKMLYKKTGVQRTSKQIASRLSRLRKVETTKLRNALAKDNVPLLSLEPDSPESSPLDFSLDKLELSFTYKRAVQGVHQFLQLTECPRECPVLTADDISKEVAFENRRFKEDFDRMLPRLEDVPVYSVTGSMNLKPSQGLTSTPVSPLTDPALFCIDNGDFLSFMEFKVIARNTSEQFLSWKSLTTIYKDEDKVLLSTREQINGYRYVEDVFDLHVPFMNHFWAGYLTFLSNGSNTSSDIKNLYITQVIYEGENEMNGTIHGYLTYKFEIGSNGSSGGFIRVLKMQKNEKLIDDDLDENATVLVHSSPLKSSPQKGDLTVNTHLANQGIVEHPLTVPTYNASLVNQFNPNYEAGFSQEAQGRPPMVTSQSTSQVPHSTQARTPLTAVEPSSAHPLLQPSAGQMPQNYQGGFMPWSSNAQFNPQVHPQMVAQAAAMQAAAQSLPQNMVQGATNIPADQYGSERYVPVGAPNLGMANNAQAMMMQRRSVQNNDAEFGANANMVPSGHNWQGQMPQNVAGHFVNQNIQPCINSAPASQLHFFPQNEARSSVPNARKSLKGSEQTDHGSKPNNNNITFGPIMGYDPLRDNKTQPKKNKGGMNIHKFSLNPQIMYKPKKQ